MRNHTMANSVAMMTRTEMVRHATAFQSWEDLTRACNAGYVPTLTVGESDDRRMIHAKSRIAETLILSGFRVMFE
jgi:hypothetical protein